MATLSELEQENRRLKEELERQKVLGLFHGLEARVKTSRPEHIDPKQIERIREYHEKRWREVEALSGEEKKEACNRFVRLVRSALDAQTLTASEAEAWLTRCRVVLS